MDCFLSSPRAPVPGDVMKISMDFTRFDVFDLFESRRPKDAVDFS